MTRILFVHNAPTRFVQIDYQMLSQHFDVTDCYIRSPRANWVHIARQVQQHDIVVGWFASWHTFLPTLIAKAMRKPCLLIVGGYDTANVPAAKYGSQRGGLRKRIATITMQQATHLVVHSQAMRVEVLENVGIRPDKITPIYLGVPEIPLGQTQREPIVLTVGGIWHENLRRKGLEAFVATSLYLPDVRFVLVGRWYDDSIELLRHQAGDNVEFTGYVSDAELTDLYQRATVYVQASLHEGFGMSVAEAMMGGCIPVVSRYGALPEVVSNHAIMLNNIEAKEIAQAIKRAFMADSSARLANRNHILTHFPLSTREQQFVDIIKGMV